jgi:Cu/Ag efflux protein CusF
MPRLLLVALAGLAVSAAAFQADEPVRRGRIKKVDADKGTLTLTVDGQDRDYTVTAATLMRDDANQEIKDRLKDRRLKEGAPVMFKAARKDGQTVLVGVRLVGAGQGGLPGPRPPKVDTSRLKPLPELGRDKYQGFEGGLYPGGKNEPPAGHLKAGLALAKAVGPLDADGKPSDDGKIVLLSVGMSNTTQEFSVFKRLADADKDKNPRLVIVDGAQGGMTATAIQQADRGPGERFWTTVDQRLKAAGVTRQQVQVAWIKEADAGPRQGFPKYAQTLQAELGNIVRLMHGRFPNLKIVYLSSRICAAFAKTLLNPEPYAYESGFAVRWLIEEQIKGEPALNYDLDKGPVKAPWLAWGPYLWANGVSKRADGLSYEESDFAADGTHPSESGRRKVARQLLQFFQNDPTARPWFVRR